MARLRWLFSITGYIHAHCVGSFASEKFSLENSFAKFSFAKIVLENFLNLIAAAR